MDIDLEYTDADGVLDREDFSEGSLDVLIMKLDPG